MERADRRFGMFVCAVVLAGVGWVTLAGDLNPPAGPVVPTMKTLDQVEPRIAINAINTPGDADSVYRIAAPGSYYLAGNVTGVAGRHGIEIVATNVTVDLNGFALMGAAGSLDGVTVTVSNLANIVIRNGSVVGWGDDGVDLNTFNSQNTVVREVLASDNASEGVRIGPWGRVSGCGVLNNGGYGIITGTNGIVEDCIARANDLVGIATSTSSTIIRCTASDNALQGIAAGIGSTMWDCASSGNTGAGFSVGTGCSIANCAAYANTGEGFSLSSACSIVGCTASFNALDGIRVSSDSIVRDNQCDSNGNVGDGAGIHVIGSDNRIEGNNCTDSDRGIDIDTAGNLVIRNSCAGNAVNWDIVANNVCGPILDRLIPGSGAILGNSAPDSTGSTHPNANFTY